MHAAAALCVAFPVVFPRGAWIRRLHISADLLDAVIVNNLKKLQSMSCRLKRCSCSD